VTRTREAVNPTVDVSPEIAEEIAARIDAKRWPVATDGAVRDFAADLVAVTPEYRVGGRELADVVREHVDD
jgi:hypothetical protein